MELTGGLALFLSAISNLFNPMADEKKSSSETPKKAEPEKSSTPAKAEVKNGKGDAPRNCFSDSYRSNFDGIDWSK